MYIHLCFLACITGLISAGEWRLLTPIIQIGKSVTLECSYSCCSLNSSTSWRVENGKSVLATSQPSKYKVWSSKDSCRLEILNFTFEDANLNYSCYHGFDVDREMLNLTEKNFINTPTDKTYNEDLETRLVNVSLERVYPAPICSAFFNGTDVSEKVNITSIRMGKFYSSSIIFSLPDAKGSLDVKCTIGKYQPPVFQKQYIILPTIIDKTADSTNSGNSTTIFVLIGVCIILFLPLAVIVIAFFKKNAEKNKRNKTERKETKESRKVQIKTQLKRRMTD